MLGYLYGKRFGLKIAWANRKEDDRVGAGSSTRTRPWPEIGLAWKPSHSSHLPACEDGIECSETSEYKIHKPGNYPEEIIQQGFDCPTRNVKSWDAFVHFHIDWKDYGNINSQRLAYSFFCQRLLFIAKLFRGNEMFNNRQFSEFEIFTTMSL